MARVNKAKAPASRLRREGTRSKPGRTAARPGARCPELLILSRTKAASYVPSGVEVCISISNSEAPDLVLSPGFRDVLRLWFDDIDEGGRNLEPLFVVFRQEHAQEIITFAAKWRSADRIVVHCLAGLSRSPAVAMGLCEVFGWPLGALESDHPLWNKWVRGELVRVGRELSPQCDD